jgi:TRAP-type C4-dicarboxylate transport system permease small subunit
MRRLTDAYSRLLDVLLGISVAALMLPVTIQIVARYTALIPAWIWTEEMARFLFIWMVMLGAMIGVREGHAFRGRRVAAAFRPRQRAARIVTYVFILVFACVFVWYGIQFVQFGWNQNSELAEMPMAYIFVAWPLAGITWLLFLAERLRSDLRILRGDATAADFPPPRDPAEISASSAVTPRSPPAWPRCCSSARSSR